MKQAREDWDRVPPSMGKQLRVGRDSLNSDEIGFHDKKTVNSVANIDRGIIRD